MEHKEISQAVISRLPRYYRYLGELRDEGVERISSQELSKKMHVTASQIRQDLNHFGGFGQQGYGYNVEHLYVEIAKILGLDKEHNLILIGAGNLGQALLNYTNFARRGFIFRGIFDHNPKLHGMKISNLDVRPMEEINDFVAKNNIDIAVLTIPKNGATSVFINVESISKHINRRLRRYKLSSWNEMSNCNSFDNSKKRNCISALFLGGRETKGLDEELLSHNYEKCIRIPMMPDARSLNLSNSVAIVLYEA